MQSRMRLIPANYQNPEKRHSILQPPERKLFPNLPLQNHHPQRDEPGEESPKQAGPGALLTNTNRPPQSPRTATQLDPTKP